MGRRVEFRYQAGKTLTAQPRPVTQMSGMSTIDAVETEPGVYLWDNLPFAAYEIRDGSVAVGAIGQYNPQSSLAGKVAFATIDAVENSELLPAQTPVTGTRLATTIDRLRIEQEFAQLVQYGVQAEETSPGVFQLSWIIGFQPGTKIPRSCRLVMVNLGTASLTVGTFNGSGFQNVKSIRPTMEPVVVEVPMMPGGKDASGNTFVRIQASGTHASAEEAQFKLDTAYLALEEPGGEGGGGDAVFPDPSLVALGTVYGPNGDDFTGTAENLGTIPAATDVRLGVAVGGTTGLYEPALESDVRQGVMYGANGNEFTGTLSIPPAGGPSGGVDVLAADGTMTLVRGDDYDGESTPAPVWSIPAEWTGIEEGATAKVGWRGTSGVEEFDAELDVSARTVTLKLTSEQTRKLQSAADLRYDVQVILGGTAAGLVRTLIHASLVILDTYTDA